VDQKTLHIKANMLSQFDEFKLANVTADLPSVSM